MPFYCYVAADSEEGQFMSDNSSNISPRYRIFLMKDISEQVQRMRGSTFELSRIGSVPSQSFSNLNDSPKLHPDC